MYIAGIVVVCIFVYILGVEMVIDEDDFVGKFIFFYFVNYIVRSGRWGRGVVGVYKYLYFFFM